MAGYFFGGSDVVFEELRGAGCDGTELWGVRWRPVGRRARGAVVLLHGLGEHTGRHAHVAAALARRGLGGVMFDLRGHGRSGGRRGDARDYALFLLDVRRMAGALEEGLPRALLGFSFGGQVAAYELLGGAGGGWVCAALAAPWFRLRLRPAWWRVAIGRLAAGIAPGLRQRTNLRPEQMSADVAHLRAIDPAGLTHGWISARLYFAAVAAGEEILRRAGGIRLPLGVWHGAEDPVTCPRASEEFVARAGSADKRFTLLPGVRHEPQNDTGRADFLDDLGEWLAGRMV